MDSNGGTLEVITSIPALTNASSIPYQYLSSKDDAFTEWVISEGILLIFCCGSSEPNWVLALKFGNCMSISKSKPARPRQRTIGCFGSL